MANLTAYPIGTPKSGDLIIGTSVPIPGTNQKSTTKNFSINEVVTLATENYVELTKQLTSHLQLWLMVHKLGLRLRLVWPWLCETMFPISVNTGLYLK